MSRIEKTIDPQKNASVARDEIIERLGDGGGRSHRRFSCLLLFLSCLVFFVLFVTWQVAATGVITIPIVSSFAFSSPKPVRVVAAGISVEQLSQLIFTTTLTKRLQTGGGVLSDRSITLALPESALTTTLQNELKHSKESFIDITHAQIAVRSQQELELFLPIQTRNQQTALTAHISLVADKGLFDLKLLDVKLGSLQIPSRLIASLVQPFVNRELASLNQSLSSYMHVDSLTTQDGVLNVSGTFTIQLKK